mmetsp:Transcript_24119/g.47432  ORF Transcript_24119/g.47432 Transcript_24119/m.47432 type:complete len:116 (+) Transcript_24119:481-828(+)
MILSVLFNLLSVIMATVYINHLTMLMVTPADIIWFCNRHGVLLDFPDLFMVFGITLQFGGCFLQSFEAYGEAGGKKILGVGLGFLLLLFAWFAWTLYSSNVRGHGSLWDNHKKKS